MISPIAVAVNVGDLELVEALLDCKLLYYAEMFDKKYRPEQCEYRIWN